MTTLELERAAGGDVIGIDEAGRGPLAGPVYAAAVHLPLDIAERLVATEWKGMDDSKKLSAKKRDALARTIKETPGCIWAVACASPREIDELNILRATHLAMRRAAQSVVSRISRPGAGRRVTAIVDGLAVDSLPVPSRNVIKGDSKSVLIAAASILAKTARDADCIRMEAEYPGYGFARHKGYPTREHLAALARLGPCPEHRRSFGPVKQLELPL